MKDETKPQNEERKLDFQSSGDNQGDFKPQEDAIPKGYDFNGGDEKKKKKDEEKKEQGDKPNKPSAQDDKEPPKQSEERGRKIDGKVDPSEEE